MHSKQKVNHMLKTLGVIFIVLIVLFVGAITFTFFVGSKLKSEAKAYVDSTVPILVKDWDPNELKSRANKNMLANTNDSNLNNIYSVYKKLGKMTKYIGSNGNAIKMLNGPDGIKATAQYIITAQFENGIATITLGLFKVNESWEISSIYINSPLFLTK